MPFNTALSSTQLNHLRGVGITGSPRFNSAQYLSVSSNLTVFAARVNQSAFTASFAQVTFDTVTTGAYTDIEVGMTVLFSASNDKRTAYHTGRVRKTPTSSVLYIDETSASISDGDRIFILNDYRVAQRLLRFANDTLYVDYDYTYTAPPPIIYGLQSAYAGWASGTPEGLTVAFAASAFTVTDSATISSYAYTLPSGTTVTAGNTATANVTVRFDPSPNEYWVKLVVTDSNGNAATRRIAVWSHNSTYPPATGFTGASIRADLDTGFNASVSAFDGVSSTLDNTLVCIWSVDTYNDTETAINGNVNFVGRLRRETTGGDGDALYSTLPRDTEFEVEGVGSQLARLTAAVIEITNNASPSVVGQIKTLTLWRAMAYLLQIGSTYLTLHSLTFDDVSATFQTLGVSTQDGSMLAAVNDLAQSINSAMEFAPAGESQVVRDASYQSTTARNALTTVADWTEADVTGVGIQREMVNLVGRIEASGASFNANNNEVTPVLSIAPGVAQSEGEGTGQLTRQILARNLTKASAQAELNGRSGNDLANSNRDTVLNQSLPDGYYFLTPSRALWHTWTLSSSTNNRGLAYTSSTRWQLVSIDYSHDNETGINEVSAVFDIETQGAAGQSVEYPPPTEIGTALPPLPAFNTYPAFPDLNFSLPSLDPLDLPAYIETTGTTATDVLSDGNTVAIATDTQLWILTDVKISSTPPATEVTPSSLTDDDRIRAFKWTGFGVDGYLLTYNVTDEESRVWYSSDVLSGVWAGGDTIDGDYTNLRVTGTEAEVYIGDEDTAATVATPFSYLNGNGDIAPPKTVEIGLTGYTLPLPTYDAVNDWYDGTTPTGITNAAVGLRITKPFAGQTFTAISFTYDAKSTRGGGTADILINGVTTIANDNWGVVATRTNRTVSWAGSTTIDEIRFRVLATNNNSADGSYARITAVSYTISTPSGNVTVAFSEDNGVTINPPVVVGGSAGTSGMDTVPLRSEVMAGRGGQVEIDDGEGGAFANYGDPMPDAGVQASLIVVPRYEISTSDISNSSATPDYILGSTTLDTLSSQIALYAVSDDGITFDDITPNKAADYGTVVSPNSVTMPWVTAEKIAGVFDFNGTRALYVSTPSGIGFWDDTGNVGDNADYVRMRKSDPDALDLYYVDDVLVHSPDFGQTKNTKITPNDSTSDPLILVEIYDA